MKQTEHQADSATIIAAWIVLSEQSNPYLGIFFAMLFVIYLVIRENGRIPVFEMPGRAVLYLYLIWGSGLGFSSILLGKVGWWPVVRDAVQMGEILILWFICAYLSERNDHDRCFLYKTLFLACALSAAYSVVVKSYILLNGQLDLSAFRSKGNPREFSLALGCYLAVLPPDCCKELYWGKQIDLLGKLLIFAALLISFSRTAFVLLGCLLLLSVWNRPGKVLKALLIAVCIIVLAAVCFPNAAGQFWEHLRNSFTELSSTNTHWSGAQIVKNWRGYEVHCAQENFRQAGLLTKLLGQGFGGGIDAFGYEYLVTGEKNLSHLHNGYYTTGFKFGILGVGLMVVYYLQFLLYAMRIKFSYDRRLAVGTVLAMYLSTAVISGVLWGGAEVYTLMVLAWYTSYSEDDDSGVG